jgi:hypothetical protein
MFVVTGIGVISAGASQAIERLRLLADDLERIEQGELPTAQPQRPCWKTIKSGDAQSRRWSATSMVTPALGRL